MSHERVFTSARVHVPDPDAGVQTPGHNVHSIKLKKGNIHCSDHLEGFSQTVVIKSIQPQHLAAVDKNIYLLHGIAPADCRHGWCDPRVCVDTPPSPGSRP